MEKQRKRNIRIIARPEKESYVYVFKHNGEIRLSYGLAKKMNVRESDRVSFFLEEVKSFEEPELYIAKHSNGFELRRCSAINNTDDDKDEDKIRSVRFYSKELANQLLGKTCKSSIKLRVGESFVYDEIEYLTIIYPNGSRNKIQGIDKAPV